jgi:hypothetical protein
MAAALRWLLGIDASTAKWDPRQYTVERKALPAVGLAEAAPFPPQQPSLCSTFHYRNPSAQDPMRVDQPPLRCQQSAWLEEEATHFPTGTGIRVNQLEPGLYNEMRHNSFRTERRVYKGRKKDRFTGKMMDLYEDDPPPPNGDFQTFGGKHAMRKLQGDDLSQPQYEGLKRQETTFADEPVPDVMVDQAMAANRHDVMARAYRDIVYNQDGKTPFDDPYRAQDAYPVGYVGLQNMVRHTPVLPPTARETIAGCSGAVDCAVQQQPATAEHRGSNKPSLALNGERNAGNAFAVAASRDADMRRTSGVQLHLPHDTSGRAGVHAHADHGTATHIPRAQQALPTAAGHYSGQAASDNPTLTTHKDSTLATIDPHITTALDKAAVHSQVGHLNRHPTAMPAVGLLQVGANSKNASHPTAHLADKEHATSARATLQQAPRGLTRNTQPTQTHDATHPGTTHLSSSFPHTETQETPGMSRTGHESQDSGTGPASFPVGTLPVSDTSHRLRTDSTYSPLVTVWEGPSASAAVPHVTVADHEQTVERDPAMQPHTLAAAATAVVRAADREVAESRQASAQQEGLGGRTQGSTDHVAPPTLRTPNAGQPCYAMTGEARESRAERTGHDAVSLVETTQAGGHGATQAAPVIAAVQCAEQEKTLPAATIGHGSVLAATAHGASTTALAPLLDNTRTTFGVGEGDSAQQARMASNYTLKDERTTSSRASVGNVEQHAPRTIPAPTERPTELALPAVD